MANKVTVISTVLNEAATITQLLDSLLAQTYPVHEVVIVDGGSRDTTLSLLKAYQQQKLPFSLRVFTQTGNRSIGRNYAIAKARNDVIAITDAGCIPHADWVEKLLTCFKLTQAQVIAGYYDAHPKTPLETAVIPYVFVMPDQAKPNEFLPATRSMLLTKSAWLQVGGFDEKLSDNEDYAFAHALKSAGIQIAFSEEAKVSWLPRTTLKDFYTMIFRFARGDIRAGILRKKVFGVFLRYSLGILLLVFLLRLSPHLVWPTTCSILGFYTLWAIAKNVRYAQKGWYWLPILQYTADVAVMLGSLAGWRQKLHVSR